jgi:hypothetical protein
MWRIYSSYAFALIKGNDGPRAKTGNRHKWIFRRISMARGSRPTIGAEDLYNGTEISTLDPSIYLQETPKNFELLFAKLAGFASAFSR